MGLVELRAKLQPPTNNPYDAVFTKRISILITAVLAHLGATANQVSAFNLAVGLAACVLIAFGAQTSVFVAAGLVHLYQVLDSVDGELARLRRQFSLKGLFLEDLSAFYMMTGFPLAVGLHVYRASGSIVTLALAVAYAAFGRNGMSVARRALLRSIRTKRPVTEPLDSNAGRPSRIESVRRAVDDHLLNHTNIRVLISTLLVIETALGATPGLTAAAMAVLLAGLLVREIAGVLLLVRGETLDGMLRSIYEDAKIVNTDNTNADGFRLAR